MKICCQECAQKSHIQQSNRQSVDHTNLLCSCTQATCGLTFSMDLKFSHSLRPSAKHQQPLVDPKLAFLSGKRIHCRYCGGKSNIQKTNRLSLGYADLYCLCNDPTCGHAFVMNLTFNKVLSPSAQSASRLTYELINALDAPTQQTLKQQLSLLS